MLTALFLSFSYNYKNEVKHSENLWKLKCLRCRKPVLNKSRCLSNLIRLAERITVFVSVTQNSLCFHQNTPLISESNPFTVSIFFLSVIIPDAHFWLRQRRLIRGDLIRLKTCQGLTEHLFRCVFGKINMYSPKSGPTQSHMKTKASSAIHLIQ